MWNSLRRRAASLLGRETAKQKPAASKKIAPEQQAAQPQRPQPTIEVEDALRRSALRGTNAARAAANVAMERASLSLKGTVGEARAGLEKTSSVVQDELRTRITGLSDKANTIRQSASDTIKQSAEDMTHKLSSRAVAAGEQVYQRAKSTKEVMSSQVCDAAASASQAAPRVAAAATRVASDNVKGAAGTLINEARETKDKALRWIWWWSLAAVGIYGFATSLPREMIRYYASKQDDNSIASGDSINKDDMDRQQEKGQQISRPNDSSSTGGSFWKRAVDKLLRRPLSGDVDSSSK